jgi:hypothetical protein
MTQTGLNQNQTARSTLELPPRRRRPLSLVQEYFGRQPRPQTAILVQRCIYDAVTNLRTWCTYWILLLGTLVALNSLSGLSIMVIFLLDRSAWHNTRYTAGDDDCRPLLNQTQFVDIRSFSFSFVSERGRWSLLDLHHVQQDHGCCFKPFKVACRCQEGGTVPSNGEPTLYPTRIHYRV